MTVSRYPPGGILNLQQLKGGIRMAVLEGCEAKYKTPVLEERKCPECGEDVEVFTVNGKITEDSACDCGYVFRAEDWADEVPAIKSQKKKEKKESEEESE